MIITFGCLCQESNCSAAELDQLKQLLADIQTLLSESIQAVKKDASIELRLAARVSNAVEASLFAKEFGCFLVQPLTAGRVIVDLPQEPESAMLAAGLLARRADILAVAARTQGEAEQAARRLLAVARDSSREVVGICIQSGQVLGVYDVADAQLKVRPVERLRLTVASLAEQRRATLAVMKTEQPPQPGWTLGGIFPLTLSAQTLAI